MDGKTGFLVAPEDMADIAGRLETVLSNRELSAEVGRQGRARVKADFSWAGAAARVRQLITSMAALPTRDARARE